jgi:hypothetical protein
MARYTRPFVSQGHELRRFAAHEKRTLQMHVGKSLIPMLIHEQVLRAEAYGQIRRYAPA